MDIDPYAPPTSPPEAGSERQSALREVVVAWEKLRLLYNGLLALPGALVLFALTDRQGMPWIAALVSAAFVAVAANACFLLGPLAEVYLRGLLLGGRGLGRGRWLIFGAGTVLSLGIFVLVLVGALSGPF